MRVAKSYVGYEYDETKAYEKNGKMYVSARCKCDRCTKGVYITRVENGQLIPHPAFGGVCLKCGGSGFITKEVRLYTDKEFEQMENDPSQVFRSFCREEMGQEATPHFVELFEKAVRRYEEGTI